MSAGDDGEDFFDYAKTAPAAGPQPPYYPAPAQYPMPPYPAAAYPGPYFPPPGAASMPYPPGQYYPQGPQPYPADPYAAARQPGPLRNLDGSLAMPSAAVRRPPPRKVRDAPSETELFDFLPEPQVRDMKEPAAAASSSRLPGLSRLSEVRGWAGRRNRRQQLDPSQMTSDVNRLPDVDTAYEDAHPTILNEDEKPALYDLTQDFYVVKDEAQAQGSSVLTAPDGDPDARVLPLKEPLLDFGEPGEPAGISTWVVGGVLAVASVTALIAGGPGACLFLIAEVSLLTGFYVMATSRMSWARIGGKRLAGVVMAGSVGVFMLGAALSPPSPDPVTVEKVSTTVQRAMPGH